MARLAGVAPITASRAVNTPQQVSEEVRRKVGEAIARTGYVPNRLAGGLAAVPVIKVATRSDLARRWHDLMDVNAGTIVDGTATIQDVGWELFRLMLDVASGRRKTWAEHWKLHNALVLFNPAPVT